MMTTFRSKWLEEKTFDTPKDATDKTDKSPPVDPSPENMQPDIPNVERALHLEPTEPKTLADLRHLLNSGQLDGRRLVVCGYRHPDIGAVVREYFGHRDNVQAEGLNPGFFEVLLYGVLRALEHKEVRNAGSEQHAPPGADDLEPLGNITFGYRIGKTRMIDLVLDGSKTQTRRPTKDKAWTVGGVYGVVPKKGAPPVALIKLLDMCQEHVGDITDAAARAEGVKDAATFKAEWAKFKRGWDSEKLVWVLEFKLLQVIESEAAA